MEAGGTSDATNEYLPRSRSPGSGGGTALRRSDPTWAPRSSTLYSACDVYPERLLPDILPSVTKRLIDVDDTLLEQAGGVLRTRTMKDTVNQALGEVVRAELRRRHADRLVRMDGLEVDDQEVMAGAWRS